MSNYVITTAGKEARIPSSIPYNPSSKFDRAYNAMLNLFTSKDKMSNREIYRGLSSLGPEIGISVDKALFQSLIRLSVEADHLRRTII